MRYPASVNRLVAAALALSTLGLLTVVLTVVLRDDLVRSWAEGRSPQLRETLRVGGVEALAKSGTDAPAFVPVAIVLFVVLVMLVWVLVAFVRLGHGWGRLVLTGLMVFTVVATVAGIRTGPPAVFVAVAGFSYLAELAVVFFLWRRDTTAFLRGTWTADDATNPAFTA